MSRYRGALNGGQVPAVEFAERLREMLVGKTIESVDYDEDGTDEKLVLRCPDGTVVAAYSYDYEGYSSGFYFHNKDQA